MATYSANNTQKTTEIRTYTVDFSNDLPSGGTVTAGTATHIPPSGSAGTCTITVSSPYVYVTVPAFSVTGIHYVDVLATFSNADKSAVRIQINGVYDDATCRSGMVDIVKELRRLANAGPADYTLAGEQYWTDAQLEEILDRHYEALSYSTMEAVGTYGTTGAWEYTDYYVGAEWLEQTTGGTATFYVQNSTGAVIAEADYSVDYQNGVVTFDTNTNGDARYVTGYYYDVNAAAAEVWRKKAAYFSTAFDFSTDNHSVKRSQIRLHCLEQAEYFETLSEEASESADLVRGDDILNFS